MAYGQEYNGVQANDRLYQRDTDASALASAYATPVNPSYTTSTPLWNNQGGGQYQYDATTGDLYRTNLADLRAPVRAAGDKARGASYGQSSGGNDVSAVKATGMEKIGNYGTWDAVQKTLGGDWSKMDAKTQAAAQADPKGFFKSLYFDNPTNFAAQRNKDNKWDGAITSQYGGQLDNVAAGKAGAFDHVYLRDGEAGEHAGYVLGSDGQLQGSYQNGQFRLNNALRGESSDSQRANAWEGYAYPIAILGSAVAAAAAPAAGAAAGGGSAVGGGTGVGESAMAAGQAGMGGIAGGTAGGTGYLAGSGAAELAAGAAGYGGVAGSAPGTVAGLEAGGSVASSAEAAGLAAGQAGAGGTAGSAPGSASAAEGSSSGSWGSKLFDSLKGQLGKMGGGGGSGGGGYSAPRLESAHTYDDRYDYGTDESVRLAASSKKVKTKKRAPKGAVMDKGLQGNDFMSYVGTKLLAIQELKRRIDALERGKK